MWPQLAKGLFHFDTLELNAKDNSLA